MNFQRNNQKNYRSNVWKKFRRNFQLLSSANPKPTNYISDLRKKYEMKYWSNFQKKPNEFY